MLIEGLIFGMYFNHAYLSIVQKYSCFIWIKFHYTCTWH